MKMEARKKRMSTGISNSVVAIKKQSTVNLEKMEKYQAVGFSLKISQPLMCSTIRPYSPT